MRGVLTVPDALDPVQDLVGNALTRVTRRFDRHLRSNLAPVQSLVSHVERYRGKMLRPTLSTLAFIAARPDADRLIAEFAGANGHAAALANTIISDDLIALATTCEMVHMATLVHDDVLDEANTRRGGLTVNHLEGNEPAVILGDYLIAGAYNLCCQIADAHVARATALEIGRVSMVMCAGELLQLHHRHNLDLDRDTYFRILEGKTATLIGAACELGGMLGASGEVACDALRTFGLKLGIAFQIQDDLLDLLGDTATLGKNARKDLEMGKLTLPFIHHLEIASPAQRALSRSMLASISGDRGPAADNLAHALIAAVRDTGSIDHTASVAGTLVSDAKSALHALPASPARDLLNVMADAVISRAK